tara:strand:+ start:500 stop:1021 length:522 start_codon:yes stop_codon:yes gene_type:complete
MNKKNNHSKRTFVPQAIGDTLKRVNRNFSSKFGKLEFLIQSKWPEITGSYFAEYSEPSNITRIHDYENDLGEIVYKNHLNVRVAPAAALEFQHFKDTIIEKINSYFGFKAIFDLRIQQNYIPKYKNIPNNTMKEKKITKKELDMIELQVNNLNNEDLKKSLIDLGTYISKVEK